MKKGGIVGIIALFICGHLVYAESNTELLGYYDSELIQFSYATFGGFTLSYHNQTFSAHIGIPRNLKTVLYSYPDSREYVEAYAKLNVAGNNLLWGGGAAWMVEALLPTILLVPNLLNPDSITMENAELQWGFMIGLVLGGITSSIIGSILYPASLEKLYQGVNAYDRHKISEYW